MLGHLPPQLRCNVPKETECQVAAYGKQGRGKQAKQFDTKEGKIALHQSEGFPGAVKTKAAKQCYPGRGADGLANAAQHIEGAVNGSFGALFC